MATYKEIQKWVKSNYGFTVNTCWIAHAKETYGIPMKNSHNRYNSNSRKKPCPQEKLEYIKKAFEHFDMI